eukprot:CAMPEP_0170509248 /NCGR_PEP_ID=MMETSP0208-20121228/64902_1 /TAXON_ID=197538 /ORGANISM="Strombidium inclinatum, Strain S3" /LENGTH=79 /DNA_ID=CAMNT_0010792567 /DNA_START=291 /DNA_END=529 /DNA_ORIENTATION=+
MNKSSLPIKVHQFEELAEYGFLFRRDIHVVVLHREQDSQVGLFDGGGGAVGIEGVGDMHLDVEDLAVDGVLGGNVKMEA